MTATLGLGLLLAADDVTLYRPSTETDAHGWALPGDTPSWSGTGNLQLSPGASDPQAATGGGHGPHDPARTPTGTLYLPPGVDLSEGTTAVIRGGHWILSQVRKVTDPSGLGADCWAATATGTDAWPGKDGDPA